MPLSQPQAAASDGWTQETRTTWTRASNTTFTVSGTDVTAQFPKGTRLKVTDTTTKYFVVTAASFSTNTTITFTGGDDYVLAATPTAQYYSYQANPQGYPGWFNYAPTYTGFSTDPNGGQCRFMVVGNTCYLHHERLDGTSNASTFTMTLPITSLDTYTFAGRGINNGSLIPGMGLVRIYYATNTTISFFIDGEQNAWTGSGAKNMAFNAFYQF